MTADLELWRDGWDAEPDTADPPPDRRGNPYANVHDDEPDAYRNIHTIKPAKEYL
ncbi:hypothetical protein [Streptomyces sp. NPDC002467]|uniref:hypothetical protein n=1 Tax=Streptomyces sp. NPDC002467 TaxID=3364647 RepID=UPI00368EFF34